VNLGVCKGGWYSVKPRGYVCLGPNSTTDANDPRAVAAREVLPDITKPLPFHVGVAIGSPQYLRIPTAEEQRAHEKKLDAYLANVPAGDAVGAIDTARAGRGPSNAFTKYLESTKPDLVSDEEAYPGRKIAWAREFDAEGRTWLETPDLRLIPKDKCAWSPARRSRDRSEEAPRDRIAARVLVGRRRAEDPEGRRREDDRDRRGLPRHTFVPVKPNLVKGPGRLLLGDARRILRPQRPLHRHEKRTDRPKERDGERQVDRR